MSTTKIEIPRNDFGYDLSWTIQDSSGTAYDLTGYTAVALKVWAPGNPASLVATGTCSIVTASTGSITYPVASTDFTIQGLFNAEFELTSATKRESTETFQIVVYESG